MEADAKHTFQGSEEDELSFQKNDVLKILCMSEDKNWYRAELNGHEGYIPSNYIKMRANRWFVSKISRNDAEDVLLEKNAQGDYIQKDGAFLVRPSESSPGDFSLSVKFGQSVQHFKVLRDGAGKYFLWVVKFDSLNKLVRYHRTSSVSRSQTIYLQDLWRAKMIAQYDFKPQDEEELELKRGEVVEVVDKRDPNWWLGELQRDGNTLRGLFPVTYVAPLEDTP